ncbi:hypothetical protein BDZ45DRAFT_752728 [Acephala macrosclerotiorum]|nr:hypothetical protein BDZ45DRAFT_752728 [Acephala macrosclerotiorum]
MAILDIFIQLRKVSSSPEDVQTRSPRRIHKEAGESSGLQHQRINKASDDSRSFVKQENRSSGLFDANHSATRNGKSDLKQLSEFLELSHFSRFKPLFREAVDDMDRQYLEIRSTRSRYSFRILQVAEDMSWILAQGRPKKRLTGA